MANIDILSLKIFRINDDGKFLVSFFMPDDLIIDGLLDAHNVLMFGIHNIPIILKKGCQDIFLASCKRFESDVELLNKIMAKNLLKTVDR